MNAPVLFLLYFISLFFTPPPPLSSAAAIFSSSGASAAQLDRFALIVPDELLHFLANVSQSAIGKERNEGKSLPPWRCHFHTLGLAACQQTGRREDVEWSPEEAGAAGALRLGLSPCYLFASLRRDIYSVGSYRRNARGQTSTFTHNH